MLKELCAVGFGAGAGAILRFALSTLFNCVFPSVPLGTLAANLLGALGIGMALSFFNALQTIAPEWRLFVITGFLGGLTTFSTFTAEIASLIEEDRLLLAAGAIALHVLGSLCCFFLGLRLASCALSLR